MTNTTQTSVMFALAELQQSEAARQAEELAARRRQEQEARERIERERARSREAELQAQRVAEAAARLQLEVEAREAAARERVAAMQSALIQLKAERDVLHDHLQARDPAMPVAPPPAVVRWAMGGMALSLLAVVAMAIVLLTPPVRARTSAAEIHPGGAPVSRPLPTPLALAIPPPAFAAVAVARPPLTAPRPKPHPHPVTNHQAVTQPDPLACGDDPICGMKFK